MSRVVIIKGTHTIDITDQARRIFLDMEEWPYGWEEWVGDETALDIWDIAVALDISGAQVRRDEAQERLDRRAEIYWRHQEEAAKWREEEALRKAEQKKNADAMAAHLMALAPVLLARHKEGTPDRPATVVANSNPEMWT